MTTSSHLSRQLDRVPFLPDDLVAETLPRLRLVPGIGDMGPDASAPDEFTERLMQVRLGRFWRSCGLRRTTDSYDPTQGEQRYERFCAEYLPTLSPAFATQPDTKWDRHLPKLAMQRHLLHVAILDSVCWNFRPLLLLTPSHVMSLAPYKQVLLQSQKRKLAMASLKELEILSTLHSVFGGSQTRFGAIIFNTFEAAVLILSLLSHTDFPFDHGEDGSEILGLTVGRLTRRKSIQAVEKALGRLQMLADISDMAASGARVVAQLLAKATRDKESSELVTPGLSSHGSSGSSTFPANLLGLDSDSASSEQSNPSWMAELLSIMEHEESYSGLQLPPLDFTAPWAVGGTL
jgi:hypothetical protein